MPFRVEHARLRRRRPVQVTPNFKEPRIRNPHHRRFISTLPCFACGVVGHTQAAHLNFDHHGGMALKSGDDHVLPLCTHHFDGNGQLVEGCHTKHDAGPRGFWEALRPFEPDVIPYPYAIAAQLYRATSNTERALEIMRPYTAIFVYRRFGNGR